MKRTICITIFLIVILACVGCSSNSDMITLTSGNYYAEGDFEEGLTPYVSLSLDDNTFSMGAGSVVSFAANGSFTVEEDTLIATTQIATFVFNITDSNTLVLIDNGDNEYFQLAENSQFVYSDDLR